VAFVVLVALGMVEAFGELELIALLLVWASAGVAARTAAAMRLRVSLGFIRSFLQENGKQKTCFFGTGRRALCFAKRRDRGLGRQGCGFGATFPGAVFQPKS
jgi:hypothetical protein